MGRLGLASERTLERVGGRLRLVMRSPHGEEFGGTGEFIEIERPERLV
jgi:uncharacterized protein YndB with AHSA1/START domain